MTVERLGFKVEAVSGSARRGKLQTRKGVVDTPAFMPVGTAGTVKSLLPSEVAGLGAQIILGNTYHLLIRPGTELVASQGGLHRFMGWNGPILTDSGGFQVFSLANLRKVEEDGVRFNSHLDGQLMELSPERCIQAQEELGSDIMMVLDECPPAGADRDYIVKGLERDARWALRAQKARSEKGGALMGIVQGGVYKDLRGRSAELITGLDLDGYALGGLSVGESKDIMMEVIEHTAPLLPADKPRYLMGVGAPGDLVSCVAQGVDMFDCVLPTRVARNGTFFTSRGRLNIRNARFAADPAPIEEGCGCLTCKRFSRAYLRHLFMSRELLAYRLGTIHNLHYVLGLMAEMREAITLDEFDAFAAAFWSQRDQDAVAEADNPHGGKDA